MFPSYSGFILFRNIRVCCLFWIFPFLSQTWLFFYPYPVQMLPFNVFPCHLRKLDQTVFHKREKKRWTVAESCSSSSNSVELEGKTVIKVSLLPFQSRPREGIKLGHMAYGRCHWRLRTLLYYPSCYPNTNKQRRNIGVNDRGRGVEACRRGGLCALEPRSPEKWRSGGALRTLRALAAEEAPTLQLSLLQTFPRLFSATCHNSAQARGIRGWLAAWLCEKFSWTWKLENFQRRFYWSSSPL